MQETTKSTQESTTEKMRGQITIDENLWARARAAAALGRDTVSDWIVTAIRQRLEREPFQG